MNASDSGTPAVLLLGDFRVPQHRDLLRFAAESGYAPLAVGLPGSESGTGPGPGPRSDSDPVSASSSDVGSEVDDLAAEAVLLPGSHTTEIIDRAETWSARYAIRAVLPLCEQYVEAAAWIADLLALPGPGLRVAMACAEGKGPPPGYLEDRTPRSVEVAPNARAALAADWTAFPATLKQTGRLAVGGHQMVRDTAELLAGFAAAGPNRTLLLEEQPLGEERVVESLSVRGAVRRFEAGETQASDTEDRRLLAETHAEILRRLDFDFGLARARYRQLPGKPPTLIALYFAPQHDSVNISLREILSVGAALMAPPGPAHVGSHPGAGAV